MSILHIPHLPCLLASVFLHVQLVLDSVNDFVCMMLLVDVDLLSDCCMNFSLWSMAPKVVLYKFCLDSSIVMDNNCELSQRKQNIEA
jgi:hypothetical protein